MRYSLVWLLPPWRVPRLLAVIVCLAALLFVAWGIAQGEDGRNVVRERGDRAPRVERADTKPPQEIAPPPGMRQEVSPVGEFTPAPFTCKDTLAECQKALQEECNRQGKRPLNSPVEFTKVTYTKGVECSGTCPSGAKLDCQLVPVNPTPQPKPEDQAFTH